MFHFVVHSSKSLEQIVHLYTLYVYVYRAPFHRGRYCYGPLYVNMVKHIFPPPLSAVLRHCYFVSPNTKIESQMNIYQFSPFVFLEYIYKRLLL